VASSHTLAHQSGSAQAWCLFQTPGDTAPLVADSDLPTCPSTSRLLLQLEEVREQSRHAADGVIGIYLSEGDCEAFFVLARRGEEE